MENNTNNWPVGDHLENFNNPHEVTKAQVGLGNVDNVRQYSELNPPPNHINTVCGKGPDANGDIDLVKGDVNLGKVDNVKQYSEKNPPPYPVTSVNGQTGAVNITLPDTSGLQTAINTHTANVCNPHQVTKDQVGLGNVDNVRQYSVQNQPPYPVTSVNGLTGAVTVNVPDISGIQTDLGGHIANVNNPHGVTKAQIGLGNVDNTSDLAKPVSTAMQSALDSKLTLTTGAEPTTDKDIIIDGMIIARKGIFYNIPSRPKAFVTAEDTQYISGLKNFTGGLQKNGKDVADVEQGTWTPKATHLTFNSLGRYVRLGKIVILSYTGTVTNNAYVDATVQITGLPYVPQAGHIGSFGYINGNTYLNPNRYTPATNLVLNTEGDHLLLVGWGSDGRSWAGGMNVGLYWDKTIVNFSITYEIA